MSSEKTIDLPHGGGQAAIIIPSGKPTEARLTVREACRRRTPLDGTDAQALEHALSMTEAERDGALNQLMAARLHATQAEEATAERAKELDAAERAMDQQRERAKRAERRLEETEARLEALARVHADTLDRLHAVERQRDDLELRRARLCEVVGRGAHTAEAGGECRTTAPDTAHLGPFTTVRACIDCGVLIAGGPTRCLYCAERSLERAAAEERRRQPTYSPEVAETIRAAVRGAGLDETKREVR